MAVNNRTEAQSQASSILVPTLTLAQLVPLINEQILNSTVFEKDVIATETPAAGSVTINFANKDTATVTTAVNLAVSFSGLENGAVKYLVVTKGAANVISFVGALDIVQNRDYINTVLTSICYRISNKNGVIRVEGLYAPDSTTWNSLTLVNGWQGSVYYRINNISGKIEVRVNLSVGVSNPTSTTITTFPASIYPAIAKYESAVLRRASSTFIPEFSCLDLSTAGVLTFSSPNTLTLGQFATITKYFEYYKAYI